MLFLYYILASVFILFLILPFLTVWLAMFGDEREPNFLEKQIAQFDFGHIITAYKNAEIAKPLIESLCKQPYHPNFHVYLVADAADVAMFEGFSHPNFTLLRPEVGLNLKVKSIIYATERFVRQHDYTVIWDADNVAHPQFMQVMNAYANQGHKAIQGQRTAKNVDNTFSAMDALGEFYKNYIERYAPPQMGSSAVISGSGMAVESKLYKGYLYSPEIEEGKHLWKKMLQEDKILQNYLLNAAQQIVFAKNAICYDEKATTGAAVETQRSRWLYSYFQNIPNSTGLIMKGLFRRSWNQFYFGLVTFSPPLFILLAFSVLFLAIGLYLGAWYWAIAMFVAMGIFTGNIFLCLYLSDAPRQVWFSILSLPLFVVRQFKGLFKMANPNKNFKHSEHHRTVSIDEILK